MGKVLADDPAIGRIAGNKIPMVKGLFAGFDNKARLRARLHILKAGNQTLLLLPSEGFTREDDDDIGAIKPEKIRNTNFQLRITDL